MYLLIQPSGGYSSIWPNHASATLATHRPYSKHAPATYSQKWLTDTMLNENPLFIT